MTKAHPTADLDGPDAAGNAMFRRTLFRTKGSALVAMMIREARAEERAVQQARIVRTTARAPPILPVADAEDHAADLGQAALSRETRLVRTGGRLRNSAQRSAAPILAVQVDGATLFDRMHDACQLSDRQHRAGRRLHNLWRAAGLNPRVSARYPVPPPGQQDDDGEDMPDRDPDGATALDLHRRLMRKLPAHMASLLDAACQWLPEAPVGHPGVRYLATFQEALGRLGDMWGMKHDGHRA